MSHSPVSLNHWRYTHWNLFTMKRQQKNKIFTNK